MDLLHPEFILFLSCAKKNKLRYLLIGGYAVNYYGYSRNTHDLDVWIAPTIENRNAFINTLLCMNYAENEISPLYNEATALSQSEIVQPARDENVVIAEFDRPISTNIFGYSPDFESSNRMLDDDSFY